MSYMDLPWQLHELETLPEDGSDVVVTVADLPPVKVAEDWAAEILLNWQSKDRAALALAQPYINKPRHKEWYEPYLNTRTLDNGVSIQWKAVKFSSGWVVTATVESAWHKEVRGVEVRETITSIYPNATLDQAYSQIRRKTLNTRQYWMFICNAMANERRYPKFVEPIEIARRRVPSIISDSRQSEALISMTATTTQTRPHRYTHTDSERSD